MIDLINKGAVMGDGFGLEQCSCGLQIDPKEDAFEDPTFKRSTFSWLRRIRGSCMLEINM